MAICGRGHQLNSPQDRLADGTCKFCHRDSQRRYKKRCKAGVALLHAAEGRGFTVAEAISLIRQADYWTLQDCQSRDRA